MIGNITSNYNSICKLFNFSKENTANINKKILLEMAKNGEDRPKKNKTKLGNLLVNYTCKSSGTYDPIFTKQIKELRPDWFVAVSETANQKKKLLLEMAKNGEDKPIRKTTIGIALRCYTNKSSDTYDPIFTKQIKKLRPDWFVAVSEIANQKKKLLLEMAKNGEDKPIRKTTIGIALRCYTNKSHKSSYDPIFTKQIRKLKPDWFIGVSETANQNKKLLLEMAKNGEDKPHYKTKLGVALVNYTNKSSEDPIFTKQIKELRPDWFIGVSETANQNKKLLLEMAKNGEDKPHYKTKLGVALVNYTKKSSEDPIFTKQIKELRPDWFRK